MNRRGFTLVEIVMVAFVIAVIGGLAAPRVASALARQRADAAARRIVADLGLAQREAKAASADRTVAFEAGKECYTLNGVDHPDRPGAPYLVELAGEPYGAALVSANFGGDAELTYNGYGVPKKGGKVVLRIAAHCREINVDAASGAAAIATVNCPAKWSAEVVETEPPGALADDELGEPVAPVGPQVN
jgi:prepilin-type N-terminal cleavage/methylation domain-containing protein